MKRILLLIGGWVSLALGAIGLVIPVWPTTPFVLLSAGCFTATSPRLYQWVSNLKWFGEYVNNYKNKTGVRKIVKIYTLIFLYVSLGISFYFVSILFVRLILILVAIGVTIHILLLKTKKEK